MYTLEFSDLFLINNLFIHLFVIVDVCIDGELEPKQLELYHGCVCIV